MVIFLYFCRRQQNYCAIIIAKQMTRVAQKQMTRVAQTPRSLRAIPPVPVSATDKAYQGIRKAILTNSLKGGEPVPVDRFVRELKLSRTPVREAILRLQREGLIEVRPRMGTFVSLLDLRQIQEMYELRKLLEGHAARLAAGVVPAATVQELRLGLQSCSPDDCPAMSETGKKLHAIILDHCGNHALGDMLRSLQDHFVRFRSVSLTIPEKVISSHHEHLAILDALEARDGALAEALVREHFDHAARFLIDSLLGRAVSGAPETRISVRA